MKINLNKKLLLTLGLAVFLLPLLSFAASTGPDCYPYAEGIKCPFNPMLGSIAVEVESGLDVSGNIPAGQLCWSGCSRSDGGDCRSGTAGFYKIAGEEYVPMTSSEITPTGTVYLKGVGDTIVGNIYQKFCHVSGSLFGGDLVIATSSKVAIVSVAPCEVSYSSIKQNILAGQPTHITEENLNGYSQTDDKDYAGPNGDGPGSGDKRNIVSIMTDTQCEMRACLYNKIGGKNTCPKPVYFNSSITTQAIPQAERENLSYIIGEINKGYPMTITFASVEWPVKILNNTIIKTSHSCILVGAEQSIGDVYSFELIDPNVPSEVTYLRNCRYSVMRTTTSGLDGYNYGLACDSPTYEADGQVLIIRFDFQTDLAVKWLGFCDASNSSDFPDLCGRKPTEWLKNNLVSLGNFGEAGNCFGWTSFYMNMVYLGDFSGTDYHPDDGKFVDKDCGRNYHSLTKSSPTPAQTVTKSSSWLTRSRDWVTNSWSGFWNLF